MRRVIHRHSGIPPTHRAWSVCSPTHRPVYSHRIMKHTSSLFRISSLLLSLATLAFGLQAYAQASGAPKPKPEDTEFYQPVPPVVTPAATVGMPPSDAI